MSGVTLGLSRRRFLLSGIGAVGLRAQGRKGEVFHTDMVRYAGPLTDLEVFRLTSPNYSSTLTAYYNRGIARNSGWMLFQSDRSGSPQGFRLDLKTGETRQLTMVEGLDGSSLTLLPDNRSFCYFAGRYLYMCGVSTMRERQIYEVPEGWERGPGASVGPDGTHATFIERRGESSRLRMVALVQGAARTVVEAPFLISDPIPRPMRAQILYRQANEALWLINSDGTQNRKFKLAAGSIGPAN